MKKSLITGITGQDGSYLADFLLEKGYEIHGLRRRSSTYSLENIEHLELNPHIKRNTFFLHYGDLTDSSNITHIINEIKPDEVYNLAAQSHVHTSFQVPEYTAEVDAIGTLRILDAILRAGTDTKFYQASTSELYGEALETPQNENTPFNPRSPYAIAKLYSYWITDNYREAYGMFACNGILFNHESPRRGTSFVSRKVTEAAVKIINGEKNEFYLGNLNAKRDWGYAKEYVEAMWLMLQQPNPKDYVIATGKVHSVREFVEKVFEFVGIDIIWEGEGVEEKGIDQKTGRVLVRIDPYYFRPTEVDQLVGDPSKAEKELNWKPKVDFDELVELMMKAELSKSKNK